MMYSISLLLCVVVAFFSEELVNGSNAGTNQSIRRYTAYSSHHKIETAEEYRKEEIDVFLKTGKFSSTSGEAPSMTKKESVQKGMAAKVPKVPTEVLMKEYLDGGKHVKNHLNATSRGRGPDTESTEAPARAPSSVKSKGMVPPAPAPKIGKGKKKSPPPSKAPKKAKEKVNKVKVAKKVGKKEKDKKSIASDFPSTSPTPTLPPAKGDIAMSPTFDSPTFDYGDDTTGRSSTPSFDTDANGRSFNGPTDGNNDSSSNSPTVAKVVSPLAAFAGLLIVGGFLFSRRRSAERNLDGNENLMKHTREGFDVETGTVSGNTYRTGAFTEDDGTLEGSVDASEGNRNHKVTQKYLNEMDNVAKDLEEVSLGDDGASMVSFSSGAYATVNSCDGRLIDAVRASMTAEAFKPDKSKVYDTSIKPEWASRSKVTIGSETCLTEMDHPTRMAEHEDTASCSSFDDSSMKSVSYKKFIPSSPLPEEGKNSHDEAADEYENPRSVPFETEKHFSDEANDNRNETPSWMKAQLRPVPSIQHIPKSNPTENLASNQESEPEWMKKFRQMGLEKKD